MNVNNIKELVSKINDALEEVPLNKHQHTYTATACGAANKRRIYFGRSNGRNRVSVGYLMFKSNDYDFKKWRLSQEADKVVREVLSRHTFSYEDCENSDTLPAILSDIEAHIDAMNLKCLCNGIYVGGLDIDVVKDAVVGATRPNLEHPHEWEIKDIRIYRRDVFVQWADLEYEDHNIEFKFPWALLLESNPAEALMDWGEKNGIYYE